MQKVEIWRQTNSESGNWGGGGGKMRKVEIWRQTKSKSGNWGGGGGMGGAKFFGKWEFAMQIYKIYKLSITKLAKFETDGILHTELPGLFLKDYTESYLFYVR